MKISANGLQLEVEDHGPLGGEPLLLIMGLGMQLVGWHEDLVRLFVARGFRAIRFDNRDIGLSQGFDGQGVPNMPMAALMHVVGLPLRPPYTLADMADDAAGVLDALGIASAHVCGASMGGMIAQQMALRHARRVRSLTLIMTTSGARRLPGPSLEVRRAMLAAPSNPRDLESVLAHYRRLYTLIGSPGLRPSDDWLDTRLRLSLGRSYRPQGTTRQLMAILADGDRSPQLSRIGVPTQVIHGAADPLVPVAAGHDLARKIRGARIDVIEGMGHDLPQPLWPRIVADVKRVADRANVS
jgi:pimeloyl-ACP methyl ester carboxylesterase